MPLERLGLHKRASIWKTRLGSQWISGRHGPPNPSLIPDYSPKVGIANVFPDLGAAPAGDRDAPNFTGTVQITKFGLWMVATMGFSLRPGVSATRR